MTKTKKVRRILLRVLLILSVTLLFVYPFWWMIVNSLNTTAQVVGKPTLLPVSWRWENYKEIFQIQPFGRHLLNSILVALIGTVGNVIIAAFSGYAFARIRFHGREILFILLLTALMMPLEVIIIPLFFQMRDWGFNDSLKPLMLIPIFGAQGAFSSFMFRQFFITIPKELEEAARLDGLGSLGIFCKIMLPIAGPVISATAILAFLAAWNTYLEPLVFTSSLNNFTLPLSLNNFNDVYGQPQWNLQMAATTISILPIMLVYLIFQEKVTDAMVNSGLKG